jgi:two-component system sensor histidine kinase ChiS
MVKRKIIICVDDEITVLRALKEQLARHFTQEYRIECAEDAEQAIELFKELCEDEEEVPVVISDYIMPGIKGDQLLTILYSLDPRIKKIMLTGQADADAVGRAVNNASLYRYLSKPWEQNDLLMTIQEAIKSYYQDRTLEQQNAKLVVANQSLVELNEMLNKEIELFNKFVPNQFLKLINMDLVQQATEAVTTHRYIQLSQSAEKELTIMFSDIRSFTAICEKMSSSQAFEFVNKYLREFGPIIGLYNGFVDKFIGDAIMALFEKPGDAVDAAIAMQERLISFNQQLIENGQKPIQFGIGINTDMIHLGTIGEDNRLQTTVIGDGVNLTQRTEQKAKEFSTKIVITENTLKKLSDQSKYAIRFLDRSKVKGKASMTNFYEILDAFPEEVRLQKLQAAQNYRLGVLAFIEGDLKSAESLFQEGLKNSPEDPALFYYLSKCQVSALPPLAAT